MIQKRLSLKNEDVVQRILENGIPEELEKVRVFHNLTEEQIKLLSWFANLRRQVHEQMRQELERRISDTPIATKEELDMGAYTESIELHVRRTILSLRRKGYSTCSSGFHGARQTIKFEQPHLRNFKLPKELACQLETKGIFVEIRPDSVSFSCSQCFGLEEIKKIWEQIEKDLLELGQPAKQCKLQSARFFRRKQKELKKHIT